MQWEFIMVGFPYSPKGGEIGDENGTRQQNLDVMVIITITIRASIGK